MIEFDTTSLYGVFDPRTVRNLVDAYEKAERHLDRLRPSALGEIDRDRVARRIVLEVRGGETNPDLLWRAAVAKVLLEARAAGAMTGEKSAAERSPRRTHERGEEPVVQAEIPPERPHAAPRHTNRDATPGSGALPGEPQGDDVGPGTG